jgi:hypothetical protein
VPPWRNAFVDFKAVAFSSRPVSAGSLLVNHSTRVGCPGAGLCAGATIRATEPWNTKKLLI